MLQEFSLNRVVRSGDFTFQHRDIVGDPFRAVTQNCFLQPHYESSGLIFQLQGQQR